MCPFCERVRDGERLFESALLIAFSDGFPVSPGHALIIPRRHEPDWLALSAAEHAEAWQLVELVRRRIDAERHPDGYNVGVNCGHAAGQTVDHAHLHVIPRYLGDQPDPRGGVRWVLPAKARYWR